MVHFTPSPSNQSGICCARIYSNTQHRSVHPLLQAVVRRESALGDLTRGIPLTPIAECLFQPLKQLHTAKGPKQKASGLEVRRNYLSCCNSFPLPLEISHFQSGGGRFAHRQARLRHLAQVVQTSTGLQKQKTHFERQDSPHSQAVSRRRIEASSGHPLHLENAALNGWNARLERHER